MDLLRVLIADDEEAARKVMRSLHWEQHGCVLVGEAEDGQQVLDFLEKTEVDVILLDIGMPVMNGLELAPVIARNYPQTKIIFLTMYREFDYAVEAMRLKAFDYLIKDASKPERLFAALERLRLESQEKNFNDRMEQEKNLQQRMENVLHESLPRIRPVRMVRIMRLDKPATDCVLLSIERKLLQLPGCRYCQPVKENEWLIFGCEDDEALLSALKAEWEENFHITVCLEGCAEMESAVQKGQVYLEEGFYHPERRLLSEGNYANDFPGQMMTKFQSDIRSCFYDVTHDTNVLNEWMTRCAEQRIAPKAVKRLLITLIPTNIASQMDPASLISALWNAYTVAETSVLFRSYLLKARLAGGGHRMEIQRVEAYVRTHLSSNLSMQVLSEQVGLSPNYLNRLFREQMNESLKGYVMRIRMETAAKMLKNSDMRVNEVAAELGFPTARYFSEAFSKYFGVTPKDYRRG